MVGQTGSPSESLATCQGRSVADGELECKSKSHQGMLQSMLEGTIQSSVSVGAAATPALFLFRAWILLDLRSCGLTGELGVVVGSGAGVETGMYSTSITLEGLQGLGSRAAGASRDGAGAGAGVGMGGFTGLGLSSL